MINYITISEASKLLGLTPQRIYQLIEERDIEVKYRRGIKVCKKSDILKLNEPVNKT